MLRSKDLLLRQMPLETQFYAYFRMRLLKQLCQYLNDEL